MTSKHFLIACLLLGAAGALSGCKESAPNTASGPAVSAICAAHGLPSGDCPFCYPDQVRTLGMCAEHGVPEALCWICRPALLASYRKQNDWCAGHDRPESLCFICNPEREAIYAEMFAAAPSSGTSDAHDHSHGAGDHGHDDDAHDHAGDDHAGHDHTAHASDAAHADHSSLTPRAQRAPSVACTTSDMRIRLESADVARSAGFKFTTIEQQALSQVLECNAEIAYDANRYSRVASRVAGVIQSVEKDVGDMVQTGEVLAVVDSAELASAKAEYLQASETKKLWDKNHAATHELVERGIASSQEDLAAENKLAEAGIQLSKAIQHLRVLGLSAERISGIESENDIGPLLPIAAPFDGEIVERTAVMGETVETTRPLFTVADTRKMWALLDVYERDIARVEIGQPVVVMLDGIPGETFGGTVVWISRQIDPRTRTLHVRAELDNTEGQLRANMFGRARITIQPRAALPAVPRDAVQWDGCCNVAFVQVSASEYQPRKLRLGIESGDYFEIKEGLSVGDTIVTQGSFMLKTELMKSSIGAGCCEARH